MADISDLDQDLLAQMREDFLAESQEILDRLGLELARLEQNSSPELINSLFREVHTLKGTAGFVNLTAIQKLAHALEDVFGEVRAGKLAVTPALADVVFQCLERLVALRVEVMQGSSGDGDVEPQLRQLANLLKGQQAETLPIPQVLSHPISTELAHPNSLPPTPAPTISGVAQSTSTASGLETTLRVEVETLDALLALAGELITARNALYAIAERLDDSALFDNALAINRLARQMQAGISSVRLVPIERLLNRFTPIVRTIARDQGKQVRYIIEGGDTPLDRTVSEQIGDPLVHMIRNAIDHGIEGPETRRRAGKPPEGTLRIRAERRGDDVVIWVSDDGLGIDPARLRQVAVARGLRTAAEVETLSDDEATRLIFAPGFSTASSITDLSGRGVGMDVVLQNVRRLRGRIDIEARPGFGTTFIITLPLTLSIMQVLLVRSGPHTYAVPLHFVRETLLLAPEAVHAIQRRSITYVHDMPLPVRHLADWLSAERPKAGLSERRPAFVIRLTQGDEVIVVDEVLGKQQMVVKPLSPYLGHVPGVDSAAILPDGNVTLILDIEQLLMQ